VLTPPTGLSDGDLERLIEQAWGVGVASLDYRPVGFGSHHWIATDNQGNRHFVTVDELISESRIGDEVSVLGLYLRRALAAATDLRTFGCSFVVAPIATKDDQPLVQFDSYAVALYPLIEGHSFTFEESLAEADRDQVLELVTELHRVPIDTIRPPATDEFIIPCLEQLEHALHYGDESGPRGPYAAIASQLLIDNETEIRRLIARYRTLVTQYLSDPGPVVITHGEIHPGNVMLTPRGWMIVDWDTVMLAPPERDLWRLAQEGGSVLRAYASATGTAPNEWLVDLYGIRWDLVEIASFAEDFRNPHEDTEDKRKAIEILHSVVGRLRTQIGQP
jgi:spectinomycin phosphotransferase/16S rRNA (guanine(1405)-N(7))-methyltransferase